MKERKLTRFADEIHFSIPVSAFEKEVISSTVFNRLHNILQDSTVYFTYPSNRTSRFCHSVGVMHLTGEMLRAGILNADQGITESFWSQVSEAIIQIRKSPAFQNVLKNILLGESFPDASLKLKCENFPDPLYDRGIPANIGSDDFRFLFLITYEAVRLSGLLHDLGHPPFSHVVEKALHQIYEAVNKKRKEAKSNLTSREETFLEIIEA